jgi:alanine-synthesizing transaminase
MQYAVTAALTSDRSHQLALRAALAERGRLTADALNGIPGIRCVAPRAAFYVLPSVALPAGLTDEDFVRALLRETGILCVHGSGFGMPPDQGFFRIVFLADPRELTTIYRDMGEFTRDFLART